MSGLEKKATEKDLFLAYYIALYCTEVYTDRDLIFYLSYNHCLHIVKVV